MSSDLSSSPELLNVAVLLMDKTLTLDFLRNKPGVEAVAIMHDENEDGPKVCMYRYTHPGSGETMDICQGAEGLMVYASTMASAISMCCELKGAPVHNPVLRNMRYVAKFYKSLDLDETVGIMDLREPRQLAPTETMSAPEYKYHLFKDGRHPRLAIELTDKGHTRGGAWVYADGRCVMFDFQEPQFVDEFLKCIEIILCMRE